MAPLPTIADVFRCALVWGGSGGQSAVNVMHISAPGATASGVRDALEAHVTSGMWSTVATGASVKKLEVTPLDGASGGIEYVTSGGAKWTGNGGADYSPGVAAIIKLSTGLRGRSNRGRLFLPFTTEQDILGGLIDDSIVVAVSSAWDTFANALVADDMALGVASYKNSNWHQAVAIALEKIVATQKRRIDRVRAA